jgi:hypothetical protein
LLSVGCLEEQERAEISHLMPAQDAIGNLRTSLELSRDLTGFRRPALDLHRNHLKRGRGYEEQEVTDRILRVSVR